MYEVTNPKLKQSMQNHGSVELTAIRAELQLLRGLVESALSEHETATDALNVVHGPLQSIFKVASALRAMELQTGDLITKAAMLELVYLIGGRISEMIGERVDTDTRNQLVDAIKPALVQVVAEWLPTDAQDSN